jgi:protein TonB
VAPAPPSEVVAIAQAEAPPAIAAQAPPDPAPVEDTPDSALAAEVPSEPVPTELASDDALVAGVPAADPPQPPPPETTATLAEAEPRALPPSPTPRRRAEAPRPAESAPRPARAAPAGPARPADPAHAAPAGSGRAAVAAAAPQAGGGLGDAAAAGGDPGARRDYAARVAAILARAKRYPEAARARRQQGEGQLAFTLDAGGRVVTAALRRGTGHDLLDAEILALLRRAEPFPPIPPETGRRTMDFVVPVDFALR